MTYYTKVAFNQNLITPQSKTAGDFFISVNDLTSCFLNPDDCIPDNPKDFRDIKIDYDVNGDFWDELGEFDKLLL